MSILQGGIGLPILSPAVYEYMVTGKYLDLAISEESVPCELAYQLLKQVRVCELVE